MDDVLNELPDDVEEKIAVRARRGTTVVLVAKGQRLLGWLEFSDRIRETSEAAIRRLKQAGIKVVMLTGDREEVAQTVAETVGITEVVAGVKPDEKAEHVRARARRRRGRDDRRRHQRRRRLDGRQRRHRHGSRQRNRPRRALTWCWFATTWPTPWLPSD